MKTLHVAYRVTDMERSLGFYAALGYLEVGRVPIEDGTTLVMLRLPDDEVVTLELAYHAARGTVDVGGFSHLVVQVEDLHATLVLLTERGLAFEAPQDHGGGMHTCFLYDPDGYRIELVQWPPGHPDGLTEADFEQ